MGTRRRTAPGTLVVLPVLVLGGCTLSPSEGSSLTVATDAATSALGTADLTVRLLSEGRVPATVADTALLDTTRMLGEADLAVATFVAGDEHDARLRDEVAAAVSDASDAVVHARSWAGAPTRDAAEGERVAVELDDAAEAVDRAAAAVEASGGAP